eukprot:331025-Amphidinium_carterae.1
MSPVSCADSSVHTSMCTTVLVHVILDRAYTGGGESRWFCCCHCLHCLFKLYEHFIFIYVLLLSIVILGADSRLCVYLVQTMDAALSGARLLHSENPLMVGTGTAWLHAFSIE